MVLPTLGQRLRPPRSVEYSNTAQEKVAIAPRLPGVHNQAIVWQYQTEHPSSSFDEGILVALGEGL